VSGTACKCYSSSGNTRKGWSQLQRVVAPCWGLAWVNHHHAVTDKCVPSLAVLLCL
jgi:hypothetical protein